MKEEKINWEQEIASLKQVQNTDLKKAIKALNLKIDSDKFQFAFAGISIPDSFSKICNEAIRETLSKDIPDEGIEVCKAFGFFIIKPYIAFLYMRSKTLENALKSDNIGNNSPLKSFSEFFSKTDDGTIGQHIRNALAHGHIEVNRESKKNSLKRRKVGLFN